MAYVKAYTGSWGLILDIRADRRWGTKYMRLSERQVEVILAAKARDVSRAAEATAIPGHDEAVALARTWADALGSFQQAMHAKVVAGEPLSPNMVAAILRNRPSTTGPAAEGWYWKDDVVYKVQAARESGHLYAKQLVVEDGAGRWELARGMAYQLTETDRLSPEDAAAFGKLYGVCAVCGRTLTDETSIERGIGPVCLSRLG